MEQQQRILVIDDDEYIRHGMQELLTIKGYNVETAASVCEFQRMNESKQFDLYMIDVLLPDGSGFDICSEIRKYSDTPIIFLTSCDDEDSITKGLDMGADDYVTKPFRSGELISRMKANLRRMNNVKNIGVKQKDDCKKRFGQLTIDLERYKIEKNGHEIKLSTIEFHLLKILVDNAGLIVRREAIFEKLWDKSGNFVEDNTLTVNMSRLKSKLGMDDRTGKSYIETVRGVGYRFVE